MKKSILAAFIIFNMFCTTGLFAAGVERYAIYVGANNGGKERSQLLYAGSDATSFKKAMLEVGGVPESNAYLLINPTKKEVNQAIENISKKIENSRQQASRTEFIFYYSGHSDEQALLLGENRYDYSTLKQTISDIPSDIHVVILDSCYSGNFIRTKGGQKKKPFLVDDSSVVSGHAYLSSSSETESSQESDEIEASFFTNSVITGLRGAADTSGDHKVTLTELYSYAFSETLKNTEDAKAGPQHPNYNITLVGSGDLVLSDFSASDSIVSIASSVKGKVILRDGNGKLVSEINKTDSMPVMLALPAGNYSVVVVGTDSFQGEFTLKKDEAFVLEEASLGKLETKDYVARGGTFHEETFAEEAEDLNADRHAQHRDEAKRSAGNSRVKPLESETTRTERHAKRDDFDDDDDSFSVSVKIDREEDVHRTFLPWDFEIAAKIDFGNSKTGYAADRWYIRNDMRMPEVTHFDVEYRQSIFRTQSVTMFAGLGTDFAVMDFSETRDCLALFLQPCVGFFLHENSYAMEGFGFAFYPCYNIPIELDGTLGNSYYEIQNAVEVDFSGIIFKNFSIGMFGRLVTSWKEGLCSPAFSFGLSFGHYRAGRIPLGN